MYNCIICDKWCEDYQEVTDVNWYDRDKINSKASPPIDGNVCVCYGNFGSTVYDPMGEEGEEFLRFSICNECIKLKADKIYRFNVPGKAEKFSEYINRNG